MKKLLCVIIALSALVLSSCTPKATRFDSKSIDNGYNNYLAGGKMAYLNNNLYISYIHDGYITLGTYKFNNDGVTNVLRDKNKLGEYAFLTPNFYQYDGKLYVTSMDDGIYIYDEATDNLNLCYEDEYIPNYFTDDLKVNWDGTLRIKYRDNPEYTIDEAFPYYVSDNKVYYMNVGGSLYVYDGEKSAESEFVSYLTDSNSNYLHICGDKVYFDHNKEDHARYESGLYCYSLKDDEFKLVFEFEDEINCLNSYNDKLYIATDKGIFTLDGKITDRSAKSIYLLDEDWIYAVENEKGNVYRVSLDGKTVEKIGF